MSTKSETGQPCIQFQLPEDKKNHIVQGLKEKIINSELSLTNRAELTDTIIKWIGKNWTFDQAEIDEILGRLDAEFPDEPPNPERISLEGVEVSFVGEEEEWFIAAYQEYKNYIDSIVLQPFERPFPATDGQTYYHKEGFLGGKEESKPIWQVVEKADNKVKIQLLGLYRHKNNDTNSYAIYIPFKHRAPGTITIDVRPQKKLLNRQKMTVSKASTQSKKGKKTNSKKSRKK